MGAIEHLLDVVTDGGADGVAMADVLHYDRIPLARIRAEVAAGGVPVRRLAWAA